VRRFSCRIYGVLREGNRVLLTRSLFGKSSFINFPGGGVEIEEAPGEALLREFVEETGLVIRPVRVLYASEKAHLSTAAPIQIVSVYWHVERVSGELRLAGNGADVLELFWSDLANLPLADMFPAELEFCAKLPHLFSS
jgi:8-oxo-dGTP pyrophosphatase MutT (NUDIX family)